MGVGAAAGGVGEFPDRWPSARMYGAVTRREESGRKLSFALQHSTDFRAGLQRVPSLRGPSLDMREPGFPARGLAAAGRLATSGRGPRRRPITGRCPARGTGGRRRSRPFGVRREKRRWPVARARRIRPRYAYGPAVTADFTTPAPAAAPAEPPRHLRDTFTLPAAPRGNRPRRTCPRPARGGPVGARPAVRRGTAARARRGRRTGSGKAGGRKGVCSAALRRRTAGGPAPGGRGRHPRPSRRGERRDRPPPRGARSRPHPGERGLRQRSGRACGGARTVAGASVRRPGRPTGSRMRRAAEPPGGRPPRRRSRHRPDVIKQSILKRRIRSKRS